MNHSALDIGFAEKSALLARRCDASLSAAHPEAESDATGALSDLADAIEAHTSMCANDSEAQPWRFMAVSLRTLACHYQSTDLARSGADGLTEVCARLGVLRGQVREALARLSGNALHTRLLEALGQTEAIADTVKFIECMLSVRLPVTYFTTKRIALPVARVNRVADDSPQPGVIKVIAFLDNLPFATPQLVKPNVLYSLSFQVGAQEWPTDASELRLDFNTTCPEGVYTVSKYTLTKPAQAGEVEAVLQGQIEFLAAQSLLAENLVFAIRCAFRGQALLEPAYVIGHNDLRFQVVDPATVQFPSGYQTMDVHINELIRQLLDDCPAPQSELDDLLLVLSALTALLGSYAQGGVFKGVTRVSEAEFQKSTAHDLRMRLGQDLQEHPQQAGGITDLRFRGVVIELKVETKSGDPNEIANNCVSQLIQYEGVEGRQVGIALVLDLTPKERPTGDTRNNILLVDVPTHGGQDEDKKYPSKAFVFIVNGNTRNPSDYAG